MASWYCDVCDISLKASSKYQHKRSKKHQRNITHPECNICMERLVDSCSCSECTQVWCINCDQSLSKCPYCRANISGRELQAVHQEIQNVNWYYQDERPELPVFPVLDLFPPSDLYEPLSPVYEPTDIFTPSSPDISAYPLNLQHPLSFDYLDLYV